MEASTACFQEEHCSLAGGALICFYSIHVLSCFVNRFACVLIRALECCVTAHLKHLSWCGLFVSSHTPNESDLSRVFRCYGSACWPSAPPWASVPQQGAGGSWWCSSPQPAGGCSKDRLMLFTQQGLVETTDIHFVEIHQIFHLLKQIWMLFFFETDLLYSWDWSHLWL